MIKSDKRQITTMILGFSVLQIIMFGLLYRTKDPKEICIYDSSSCYQQYNAIGHYNSNIVCFFGEYDSLFSFDLSI